MTLMLWGKTILIISLITLRVNCHCFICFSCSMPSFFFLWHGFPFCLLSWTASHSMPPQVHNQGQSLPNSLSSNQSQARQQLSQNMQNSMSSNGVQSSAGLQSAMPSVSGLTQTIPNTVGQNANMQSISGVSQNPVGNSMGQGIPPNMFVNSQRQMPGRQQVVPPQQQKQSQNPQQCLYQQQKLSQIWDFNVKLFSVWLISQGRIQSSKYM